MWMLAVQNLDELIYIWSLYTCSDCRSSLEVLQPQELAACFPFEPLEKCTTFKDIFPGPKWLSRTFQVLEFTRKKSRTFQKALGNPGNCQCTNRFMNLSFIWFCSKSATLYTVTHRSTGTWVS